MSGSDDLLHLDVVIEHGRTALAVLRHRRREPARTEGLSP